MFPTSYPSPIIFRLIPLSSPTAATIFNATGVVAMLPRLRLWSLDPPDTFPMAASYSCARHFPRRAAGDAARLCARAAVATMPLCLHRHLPPPQDTDVPFCPPPDPPAAVCQHRHMPKHGLPFLCFSPVALSFNDRWTPPVISLSLYSSLTKGPTCQIFSFNQLFLKWNIPLYSREYSTLSHF